MKTAVALACSMAMLGKATSAVDIKPLILSGTEVPVGTHQYVSGMRSSAEGSSFCGGSLIAPDWILTAAHCSPDSVKFAAVGTHFVSGSRDGLNIKVAKAIPHPKYVDATQGYDFMLLQIDKSAPYTPVVLSSDDTKNAPPGSVSTVMGWGLTSQGGRQSNVLLSVKVPVVTNQQCAANLGLPINDVMLCAGGEANRDSCQMDSGGPLVVPRAGTGEDVLVGVVSWGLGCGVKGSPGVYARVSAERAWIDSHVKNVTWV